jgi:sirohydrochlorin cobaltochelatase
MTDRFDAAVLVGHGAKDARWSEPFFALRRVIADRLAPLPVELAFLGLCPPSFEETVAALARQGVRRVLVVPVFLSGGGHVSQDIPPMVEAERGRHPQITFEVAGAIGEEPEVRRGMAEAVARMLG